MTASIAMASVAQRSPRWQESGIATRSTVTPTSAGATDRRLCAHRARRGSMGAAHCAASRRFRPEEAGY